MRDIFWYKLLHFKGDHQLETRTGMVLQYLKPNKESPQNVSQRISYNSSRFLHLTTPMSAINPSNNSVFPSLQAFLQKNV